MDQRHKYKRRFGMFPLMALAAALVLGTAVRWLWNAILPALLNVNPISYWQAVGLLVLCRILFGNFGGRPGGFGGPPGGFGGPMARRAWREKWRNMSDEDRKKFRQEMRNRCGRPPENQ
ncbi:hypothetical protein [Dyadobacter bucti]|uniref:hypothetical protein n=1 Tax=Dyadobacter bucti TaxID=2572203 RepID=UPI001E3EBC92|nr:hypothetical protein [Dyadobacter bucti]